jgi:hypothetical protein
VASIPKKVQERLISGIKTFQPVLASAKARDLGEADTVRVVTDILADLFGYDKYTEITSEFAVRSTYCDIATKIDGKLQTLIEVKAIGLELKDNHVRQAIDYAANQGIDWVVLTNGITWRVYKVMFAKPIDQELVCEFDFCALNSKKDEDLDLLFLLSKEGWTKSILGDFHEQKQALSRFFVGAMLLTDPILEVVRRELRRLSPDVRIETEQIRNVLVQEVLKREVMDGPKFEEAKKRIAKSSNRMLVKSKSKESEPDAASNAAPVAPHVFVVPDSVAQPPPPAA